MSKTMEEELQRKQIKIYENISSEYRLEKLVNVCSVMKKG